MTEEEMCEQKNLNRRLPPFLIGVTNPIMFIFEDANSDNGCFSIVRSSEPHPTWRSILITHSIQPIFPRILILGFSNPISKYDDVKILT